MCFLCCLKDFERKKNHFQELLKYNLYLTARLSLEYTNRTPRQWSTNWFLFLAYIYLYIYIYIVCTDPATDIYQGACSGIPRAYISRRMHLPQDLLLRRRVSPCGFFRAQRLHSIISLRVGVIKGLVASNASA